MSALTVAMLWVTIMSVLDMSRTEGYCLYGTLLFCPRSACPVQIRAHHHIDVYTDISKRTRTGQMHQQTTEEQAHTPNWRVQRSTKKERRSSTIFKPSQQISSLCRRLSDRKLYNNTATANPNH